jgi:hypothetical protein
MIAATLRGPSYSPINYDFDSIEVFPTLEDVIEALFERYSANGRSAVMYETLDSKHHLMQFPDFGAGMSFTCYRMPEPDPDPEITATEALESARLEVHTAVHGGWHDYIVTLAESGEGTLVVQVERAGI